MKKNINRPKCLTWNQQYSRK